MLASLGKEVERDGRWKDLSGQEENEFSGTEQPFVHVAGEFSVLLRYWKPVRGLNCSSSVSPLFSHHFLFRRVHSPYHQPDDSQSASLSPCLITR